MTNPVILLGTQSNGETLPVQVDGTGRLIAEGLPGAEGPPGPEGPQGPQGPQGPDGGGGIDLPEGEFEGAVLGWKGEELTWLSPSELILPDGVFGPIKSWDKTTKRLEVLGLVPPEVVAGVTIYQCKASGTVATAGWNHDEVWSSFMAQGNSSQPPAWAFDGNPGRGALGPYQGWGGWRPPQPLFFNELRINTTPTTYTQPNYSRYKLVDGGYVTFTSSSTDQWNKIVGGPGFLEEVGINGSFPDRPYYDLLNQIWIDGEILVDPVHSLKMEVTSATEHEIWGNHSPTIDFTPGLYLKVPQTGRRIPRLSIPVTTTDIDLLRSS